MKAGCCDETVKSTSSGQVWKTNTLAGSVGAHRFAVPIEKRQQWVAHLTALRTELRGRRSGFVDAARAHLVLLLTDVSRLSPDGPVELVDWDPVLSAAFEFVELRYREQISLKDVATAVAQSSGHLASADERPHRSHRWRVDHRTAHARSPPASPRRRPHCWRDRRPARLRRPRLLHSSIPRRAPIIAHGVETCRQMSDTPCARRRPHGCRY